MAPSFPDLKVIAYMYGTLHKARGKRDCCKGTVSENLFLHTYNGIGLDSKPQSSFYSYISAATTSCPQTNNILYYKYNY